MVVLPAATSSVSHPVTLSFLFNISKYIKHASKSLINSATDGAVWWEHIKGTIMAASLQDVDAQTLSVPFSVIHLQAIAAGQTCTHRHAFFHCRLRCRSCGCRGARRSY